MAADLATLDARMAYAVRPPERLSVSEWSERHRHLDPMNNAEPGPWRNFRTPYLVGVMDAFSRRDVEVIVLMSAAQIGKSEAILNSLGYAIDQDPGPILLVYPTEKDSDKIVRNRVHPLVRWSPAVSRHLIGDDLGLKEMHFDRCTAYAAWSNSPAALASTPIRYVFLDEVAKFPRFSGAESSPVKLAEARTTTFTGRRKIVITSTPNVPTDELCRNYDSTTKHHYHVPCPNCGEFQELNFFRGVKYPDGASPDDIVERQLAWYECQGCKGRIDEVRRHAAVARGRWVQKGCSISRDGAIEGERLPVRRCGFQLSGLVSPWRTLSDVAAKYVSARGDDAAMREFFNQSLGIPWQEKHEKISDSRLEKRRGDYPAGVVPPGGKVLTCGIDVQSDHYWFAVRAWGDGERSWLIRSGACLTWDEVRALLQSEYPSADGHTRHRLRLALIDCGDGKRHEEVHRFVANHRPVALAAKGHGDTLRQPWQRGKPSRGNASVRVDIVFRANYWKDRLSALISLPDDQPAAWFIHSEVDEEYVRQMTSEHRIFVARGGVEAPVWVPRSQGIANHLWDCEVQNVVAADILGVRFLSEDPTDPGTPTPPEAESPGMLDDLEMPGWIDSGGFWD